MILGRYAAAMGLVALVARAPAIVALGLAILSAVSWCIWLERHPPA
jgi:hypothetical protein